MQSHSMDIARRSTSRIPGKLSSSAILNGEVIAPESDGISDLQCFRRRSVRIPVSIRIAAIARLRWKYPSVITEQVTSPNWLHLRGCVDPKLKVP
jgi:hypothetical protein